MIPMDYHLHSRHSEDSRADLLEMCEAAAAAGLTDICFTEHLDFDRADPAYGFFQYGPYRAAIEAARGRFAGRLTIRMGLEFDFRREFGREVGDVLAGMAFDFTIGSVHTAGGCRLYRLNQDGLPPADARALQDAYFTEVLALVGSGWCHCLGHFDYLYKQAPGIFAAWRDAWYWERVDEVLRACVGRGVALEVNTHHLLDGGMALAADADILVRYRALGGRLLTVGSDAHRPGDVSHGYSEAERAIRVSQFDALWGFEGGRPYPIAI
jgi:histidinol-phosphatase (PHP family)